MVRINILFNQYLLYFRETYGVALACSDGLFDRYLGCNYTKRTKGAGALTGWGRKVIILQVQSNTSDSVSLVSCLGLFELK